MSLDICRHVLCSYGIARIITIFFKRTFYLICDHPQQMLTQTALVWATLFLTGLYSSIIGDVFLNLLALAYSIYNLPSDERLKTLVFTGAVGGSLYCDLSEAAFAALALVLATTQFIRRPSWLLSKLRGIRLMCGPVYVIILVSSWLRFLCDANHSIIMTMVSSGAAVCVLVAAILFRPDNREIQTLIMATPKSASRSRILHGILMATSVVLTTCKLVMILSLKEETVKSTTAGIVGKGVYGRLEASIGITFGIINWMMYLAYKTR